MTMGTLRGLITLVLFTAFILLWIWAWSSRRQGAFDAAARLALDEETPPARGEQSR